MKTVIGIDTGLKGGICIIENGKIAEIHPMPTFTLEENKKKKTYVDAKKMTHYLRRYLEAEIFIEKVHSLHGMSAQSNFSMGQANGIAQGVVRGLGFNYYLVKPSTWQQGVWLKEDIVYKEGSDKPRRDTKATSLNAAKRIFPSEKFLATPRSRTPHDGMFDSALIAYYGKLYLESQ